MIIKGQARGRSRQLAAHLQRRDQNEDIHLYELRGVVATDVPGALAEMEALTAAVHSKRPLYHASISPEAHTPLSDEQVRVAADTLERKLGLGGQPRVIVVHRKQGREHVHVVWSRIDLERRRVISDGWNYRAHEEAARELEAAFGHRAVRGAHVPPGLTPRRAPKDYEYRQAERSGITSAQVSAELAGLWRGAGDAETFRKRLEEAGYTLARGDRRVFVIIDRAGNVHSLARRLGMRSRDLGARLARVDLDALPSVAEARVARQSRPKETPLRAGYRAAGRELAGVRRSRQMDSRRRRAGRARKRPARLPAGQVEWINAPLHELGSVMRRPARHRRARGASRYLADRAMLLAQFASKIVDAYRHARGEALEALLARLVDEREAALCALERLSEEDEAEAPRGHPPGRRRMVRRRRRGARRRSLSRPA